MKKRTITTMVLLLIFVTPLTSAFVVYRNQESQPVCTLTGLTGAAMQENLLYCANGTNIAPSTYREVINLAATKYVVIGTPEFVTETIDWRGCPVTDVEFTRGYHAEHHNLNNLCNPDLVVRIYDPFDNQIWP